MATKTYFLNFILICTSFQLLAQSDEQLLANWTSKNEDILLKNNKTIESPWFKKSCLDLAQQLQFTHIKQCTLIDSQNINAYIFNNGHVYFTNSMMKLIYNKHQWASILAHENAHLVLKHYLKTLKKVKKPGFFFPKHKVKKQLKQNELEADQWARDKLLEFNLDANQVYYFLLRATDKRGKNKNRNHLKTSKRIKPPKRQELIDEQLINAILEL